MRVVWTRAAQQDRAAIWDYLEARNPAAAARIDQFFSDAAAQLADFPMSGHIGEIAGTRELTPHRSYRLIYEIMRDEVWVLVLIHTARQWPPMRGENKPLDAIEEDGEPHRGLSSPAMLSPRKHCPTYRPSGTHVRADLFQCWSPDPSTKNNSVPDNFVNSMKFG